MKHLLAGLLVTFLSLVSIAQDLRIVKDNINCTYGIKNQEGNWVVEPTYILIEEYNTGYFQMITELGGGVFSPEGKPLIPCIHNEIRTSLRNWQLSGPYSDYNPQITNLGPFYFYGKKDEKQFVYNSRGEQIAIFDRFTTFELDSDFSIFAYNEVKRFTRYIDSTGAILIDSIPGKLLPFEGKKYSLVGDYSYGNNTADGNARVVNRKGESLMKTFVDRVYVDSKERICFYNGNRFGVISMSGDTIIPPIYKRLDAGIRMEDGEVWTISDENNQMGIMRNDGTILIEPQYDQLYPIHRTNLQGVDNAWMVKKDNLFGLIDVQGKTIIPVTYDLLYATYYLKDNRTVNTCFVGREKNKQFLLNPASEPICSEPFDSLIPIADYDYGYSQTITGGFLIWKEGKYGVLNSDGSKLKDYTYDFYFQVYRERYLLTEGNRITEFVFAREKITSYEWELLISDGDLHIYSNQHRFMAFHKSRLDGRIIRVNNQLQNFQRHGDLLTATDTKTGNYHIFHLKTKKKLPFDNIQNITNNGKGRYAITTRNGRHGLLNEDGRIVLDTIYTNITFNQYSTKIWVNKMIGNRNVSILMDSIGNQVLANHFDAPFEVNSNDQIVSQNQKKGLIDSKTLQWKIRPNYLCLVRMFEHYYYAGNEMNQKGIVKDDGKEIIPIIYDSIIFLNSNCYPNSSCPGQEDQINWIVTKGNVKYLADQNGKLSSSSTTIRSWKSKLLFGDDTLLGDQYQFSVYPSLDYTPSLHFLQGLTAKQIQQKRHELWKSTILKNEVLDTIDRMWSSFRSGCYQGYYWGVVYTTDQQKPNPLLEKAQKSCQCYETSRYANPSNYLVYRLQSIGTKFVTVDISHQNQNSGWDPYRGQAPPPIPRDEHINIIEQNGKARYLDLKDIFPDNDMLMQEFIEALKLRDDLKLECSSLENMLEMINGSFSLSDEGVILHLNQYQYNYQYGRTAVELLIPIERIEKLAASKWIVLILSN